MARLKPVLPPPTPLLAAPPPDGDSSAPSAHLRVLCGSIPCWLCKRPIAVRRCKDGHHFVSCLDCGMQSFIRSSAGEQRLLELGKP